ncbi:hypothetical protein EYR40_004612 [Pleurotus pulmonarius]|nr:hypothetical protein EYR38_001843 [Pleurotus pulmonarius]KAF4605822.1 hypothetical protein EYR40_004612 [Pleurotus pulmonarius]
MHLRSRGPVQDTSPTVPGHLAESSPLSPVPTNRSSVLDTEYIGQESPIPRLRALSYSEVVAGPARVRLQSPRVDPSDHGVDAAQDAIKSVSEGPKGNTDPDPAVSEMDKGRSEGRAARGADTADEHLTSVQVEAIRAAEDNLSVEQRHVLARRNKALTFKDRAPEHENRDKGKGADPANWGELQSDDEIQDVELQKLVMKSYQDLKRDTRSKDTGGAGPSNSQHVAAAKIPPTEHKTAKVAEVDPKIECGPSLDHLKLQSLVDEVERLKGELAKKRKPKKGKYRKSSPVKADSSVSESAIIPPGSVEYSPVVAGYT